jgi:glycerol-3-phosphate dehydrogenase (NAD(P)+)
VNVFVVGAGSWGSTFAALLAESGHDVTLGCRDPEQARAIAGTGRNPRYLANVDLSRVAARPLADGSPDGAELVVVAVPSRAFADVVGALPADGIPVLSLVKGLDPASGEPLSTLVRDRPFAVLSGPNHAEEVADGLPAAAVVASEDEALAERVQHALMSPRFRVYVNTDLVGVELCAAAKNVIALAAGAVDGFSLGDNAKAALITRGLAEMTRLGPAAVARAETFAGLAGLGDLVVTCWSRHSRNRRAGELIARGTTPEEAVREIGMVVEGIPTAPALRRFSQTHGVELPLTEAVCAVLEGADVREAVAALMARPPAEE